MLNMMILVVYITSQRDGLNATVKYGPVPAAYCETMAAKRDVALFLGSMPKDAEVRYECVPAEVSP